MDTKEHPKGEAEAREVVLLGLNRFLVEISGYGTGR